MDLPNRVNFKGAALKLGPINISLAPLDRPLSGLINVVNKTIVSGFEYLQYESYNAVTSLFLVSCCNVNNASSTHHCKSAKLHTAGLVIPIGDVGSSVCARRSTREAQHMQELSS